MIEIDLFGFLILLHTNDRRFFITVDVSQILRFPSDLYFSTQNKHLFHLFISVCINLY